jgi:hypothetical protein
MNTIEATMNEQNGAPRGQAKEKKLPLWRHPLTFAIAAGMPCFLEPTIGGYWRDGKPSWGIAIATSLMVGLMAYAVMDRKNRKSDS